MVVNWIEIEYIFQVDYKSYLLDFKSLPLKDEEGNSNEEQASPGSGKSENNGNEMEAINPGGHHTMEFFEMCAALITQLAR